MTRKCALIGYTGFVGSNLFQQHHFDQLFNSKNIFDIEGQCFDMVVCAGVTATKWQANLNPGEDKKAIESLKSCLRKAAIKHFVLISTIDVYDAPDKVNEEDRPDTSKQDSYGQNRYALEEWVASHYSDGHYTIVRLPALFGDHLKKNLIYDLMHPLVKMINGPLWDDLKKKLSQEATAFILNYYQQNNDGSLSMRSTPSEGEQEQLIQTFLTAEFSTLNFTDSRSRFQFYNLKYLWRDIVYALENKITTLNLATEPVEAAEVVKAITGKKFNNIKSSYSSYDMYSRYAPDQKYFYCKSQILDDIVRFVKESR